MNANVQSFNATSAQINVAKKRIVDTLAGLHDDLAALASLERALEVERLKGQVPHGGGLKTAGPDMVAPLNKHGEQVKIPLMKIFSAVDSAMSAIDAENGQGVSVAELPEVFRRSNRIEDLTKG